MDLKKQSTPTEFTHFIQQLGDVFWWEKCRASIIFAG
jgi:hypothetical protein